jgi:branched-chain amino acid aminotransferase
MASQIFMNGRLVPKEQATVSVYDHGFLYGDGVFEGIRAYGGNVFRLRDHLDRLYDSARSILLEIPYTKDEFEQIVVDTVNANGLQDAYIRIVVSRGPGDLGLNPGSCPTPNVIVIAEALALFPAESYERGLEIVTVATRRNRPDVLNPRLKSLNYLNNILAKLEAGLAGAPEALMLNTEGFVAEGSGDNIFLVKRDELWTPPSYVGALEGITRAVVCELAHEAGMTVHMQPFTLTEVYCADEVFLTGTAAEVIPVVKVDGRVIAQGVPGVRTRQLIARFRERTVTDGTPLSAQVVRPVS